MKIKLILLPFYILLGFVYIYFSLEELMINLVKKYKGFKYKIYNYFNYSDDYVE